MELHLFEQVADLLHALVPKELGELRLRTHRRGIKVWFETTQPPKEHYEAQQLSRKYIDGRAGAAIEVGFHTEHPEAERNVATLAALMEHEQTWRTALGDDAEAGAFFGRATWRRLSEAWIEPDLGDPDLAFEIAGTLVDYIRTIEPLRP